MMEAVVWRLRITCVHLTFFEVHFSGSTQVFFALQLNQNTAAATGNRTRVLEYSRANRWPINCHSGVDNYKILAKLY